MGFARAVRYYHVTCTVICIEGLTVPWIIYPILPWGGEKSPLYKSKVLAGIYRMYAGSRGRKQRVMSYDVAAYRGVDEN